MQVARKMRPAMYHRKPTIGRQSCGTRDCGFDVITGSVPTSYKRDTVSNMLTITQALTAAVMAGLLGAHAASQAKGENLGPKDSGGRAVYLVNEMSSLHAGLKPELANVHPRVYFTEAELERLRTRAHGPQKQWWQQRLSGLRALQGPPPPPPAEKR